MFSNMKTLALLGILLAVSLTDADLVIKIKQIVNQCGSCPHEEGDSPHDLVPPNREELEAELIKAEQDLENIQQELQNRAAEIKELEQEIEDLNNINDVLESLLSSRRRRYIRSTSESLTIEYCPAEDGNISDTGFNLMGKGLDDIADSLEANDISTAKCLINVLNLLNDIPLSNSERENLLLKRDDAKNQAQSLVEEKTEMISEKQNQFASTMAELEKLEQKIENLQAQLGTVIDTVTEQPSTADDGHTTVTEIISDTKPATTNMITTPEPATTQETTALEPATTQETTTPEPAITKETTTPEPATTKETTTPEPGASDAIEVNVEELEANINQAEEDLEAAQQELQELEANIEKEEQEVEDLNDIGNDLASLFSFRRRRRYIRSTSEILTIEYCPAEYGTISDSAVNLIAKGLDDIADSIINDITTAKCLINVLKYLNSLNISFTEEDRQNLISKRDAAKDQAESVVQEKVESIAEQQNQLESKKAEVEEIQEKIVNIQTQIETAKASSVASEETFTSEDSSDYTEGLTASTEYFTTYDADEFTEPSSTSEEIFTSEDSSEHTEGLTATVECPSDWESINGDCFSINTEHKTWLDAKTFCETQGAVLAQPTTASQVQALAGLLSQPGLSFGTFWVGAQNQDTTTYSWLNGKQVTAGWRNNQPSTTDPERCVAIQYHAWTGFSDSGLEVWRCNNNGRFICQISNS